jgi:replicative DNA helicase
MSEKTYRKAADIAVQLKMDNLLICQKPLEWKELKSEVRRLVKEKNLTVLIVDYWQLVHNTNRGQSRADSLAEIAKGLKQLGQELNIVVIALGQFNQEGLKLRDRGKKLSTLYLEGSGELVKSANIVLTVDIRDVDLRDSTAPRAGTLTFGPLRSAADAVLNCVFVGEFLTVEIV